MNKDFEYYYVENPKLQDWLEDKGVMPDKQSRNGKVYYYKYTAHFKSLLDKYYIECVIF